MDFIDIDFSEIEIIRSLWEKNRHYHENTSEHFKELYRGISFDQRIKAFGDYDKATVKITVAKSNGECLGYCISTAVSGKGEVESLHVSKESRGCGIGKELVIRHIEWMKDKSCNIIGVTVSQENELTVGFYRKLGFYPNTLYMQQK